MKKYFFEWDSNKEHVSEVLCCMKCNYINKIKKLSLTCDIELDTPISIDTDLVPNNMNVVRHEIISSTFICPKCKEYVHILDYNHIHLMLLLSNASIEVMQISKPSDTEINIFLKSGMNIVDFLCDHHTPELYVEVSKINIENEHVNYIDIVPKVSDIGKKQHPALDTITFNKFNPNGPNQFEIITLDLDKGYSLDEITDALSYLIASITIYK